jgi:hypothetical protein
MRRKHNEREEMKSYNLVKKIAKHGRQNVIVIPSILKNELEAGTIVQLKIDVLRKGEDKIKNIEEKTTKQRIQISKSEFD